MLRLTSSTFRFPEHSFTIFTHCCVATLHVQALLNFKLRSAIFQNEASSNVGLSSGSRLLTSLKQRVVALASNQGVLGTIQKAAQSCLESGWSLLLPTVEERAQALSSLLPAPSNLFNIVVTCRKYDVIDVVAAGPREATVLSPGQRFMTDLLGNSLMTEGALQLALEAAFRREIAECERSVSVTSLST